MIGPRYIRPGLYKKILQAMPIPCVDVVIVHGVKFLLGKRINKPAQGEWCVVGGRVLKGESLRVAVRRHVKLETGIGRMKVKKFLTVKETMFKDSAQGPPSHTINSIFLVEVPTKNVRLGQGENEEFKWFSRIDKSWHPYVKEVLRSAGFE